MANMFTVQETLPSRFHHPQLGEVTVSIHPRTRRYTFRMKDGQLRISAPPGATLASVNKAIEQLLPRLTGLQEKSRPRNIDLSYRIEGGLFRLSLVQGTQPRFMARTGNGSTEIVCPPDTDFSDRHLQEWLRKAVTESLRIQAQSILPPRLEELAQQNRLTYSSVRITTSRGRWGSCSSRKSINLSCFLLTLPTRLVDYVLLHELCHTVEMNHGERFHALLDRLTGGQRKLLEQELKSYATGVG